jgi:hypothetical protein
MDEESPVAKAERKILLEMYASINRMNMHIFFGNSDEVIFEQHLQVNLRSNFQELQSKGRRDE